MPGPIKIIFSLVVLAVAVASSYFLNWLGQGQGISQYLALFLGVFAVISFWIFPEVVNKK